MNKQWERKPYRILCKADIDKDDASYRIHINDNDSSKTSIFLKNVSDDAKEDNNNVKIYLDDLPELYRSGNMRGYSRTEIRNYLNKRMISLIPLYKEEKYKGDSIKVFIKNENIPSDDFFYSIPIFSKDNVFIDIKNEDNFKDNLNNLTYLGKKWKYIEPNPRAIIWKDDSGVYIFDGIIETVNNGNGITFKTNSMSVCKKPLDWLDNFYIDGDFVFINDLTIESLNFINNDNENYEFSETNDNEVEEKALINSRDEIFENFENCVRNKYGLTYDKKDLVNFHNSLKTNLLTILAGISGTGKSKIVTAYADSLGIKKDNNEQFNMVSVRPFWQDDSDLLGFVDTISNTYHPGDSGIVDTLISANKNRDKMYIIVFDEMNLARVEHYFSQFLSVLEKDPMDRKLQLYNKKLKARLYNGGQYPDELLIPENVRFVGTMNIDETTYQMSDKVLDRANVITLKSVKFINRLNNRNEYAHGNHFDEIGYKTYEASIRKDYSFSNNQLRFFDQLNSCINKQLPTVGIGWRTLNSIEKFVGDIDNHHYDSFNTDDAFDYQVAQRILPKIRGTKLMLNILLDPDSDDSIYKTLDDYRYISDFSFTRELLDKKKREIEVIGFAN